MGWDDNRFINTTFVQPSPGGSAVPSSGFGKAFEVGKKLFDQLTQEAVADDLKKDKQRGVELGNNSVAIDANGNITRKEMDPSIVTPEGQDLFRARQTAAALAARQNAIRNKSNELSVKFKHHPDSLKLYEESMRAYLTPFLDGSAPDIQGMLELEAEDVVTKSLIGLSEVIEDREFKSNVASALQNRTAIAGKIQTSAFLGRNTSRYQLQLKANLDFDLAAGFIDQSEHDQEIKSANIAIIAGGLFREVAESGRANLPKLQKQVRERLYGKPGSKQEGKIDKRFGIDLTIADKDLIMQRVNAQANQIYANIAQQTNAENFVMAAKFGPVSLAMAQNDNFGPGDLQTLYNTNGITKKMLETPYGAAQHLVLINKATGQHRAALRLGERQLASDMIGDLQTATAENFGARWERITKAKAAGVFKYIPGTYNRLIGMQSTRLKAFAAELKDRTEQGFDDYFFEMNTSGQLNEKVLARMMATGREEGKKVDMELVRYLQKHHAKIKGWIKAKDGGQGKYSEALTALRDGLTGDSKGVGYADDIMEYEQEAAETNSDPDPYDPNTEAGQTAIIAATMRFGVVSTAANKMFTNLAKSPNVEDGEKAVNAWRGLIGVDAPNRVTILATIPAAVKSRLNDLDKFFSPGRVAKQDEFDKWQDAMYSGDPKYDRRVDEIARQTPEEFGLAMRETIAQGMSDEGGADAWMLVPPYAAYRLFKGPRSRPDVEKFILEDERKQRNYGGHDIAPFSNTVNDTLKSMYDTDRLQYAEGEGGASLARSDVLMRAFETRIVGPSHYLPIRQTIGEGRDRKYVEEDRSKVNMVVKPLEAHWENPEVVDALVENHVRKMLETVTFKDRDLPPVVRRWWTRAAGSVATLGWDAAQRFFGWDDLVRDGWIRLEPNLMKSTQSQWHGALLLQHPTDASIPPIMLDRHWEPKLNHYLEEQEERFKARGVQKPLPSSELFDEAGAS
jgi:hypothetical protein